MVDTRRRDMGATYFLGIFNLETRNYCDQVTVNVANPALGAFWYKAQ